MRQDLGISGIRFLLVATTIVCITLAGSAPAVAGLRTGLVAKNRSSSMMTHSPAEGVTLTLATNGKSDYAIVIPADASPSEQRAGSELQRFLEEISGARLAVIRDDAPELAQVQKAIALGNNRLLRDSGARVDLNALGAEGYTILPRPPHLFIAGSPKRGTMYGVYGFLEDDLGCRWYSSKVSHIPKRRTVRVTLRERTEKPAFEYREPFYTDAWDRDWAARNRVNGSHTRLDETTGGKVAYGPFVHTFYTLVPPQQYAREHPEYYALVNGARNTERAQLCLTNPDVLRIATDTVRRWIREKPEATIFSVSQNDWTGACECEPCRQVVEEEGAQSGVLLRFVNALAEQIEKEYPEKLIDTLAYWYTEDPPRHVRPRPNVRIRLAPIGACFAHPFGTCEQNRKQFENLQAWSRITNQLYIWHYVTNFAHYLQPFPNLDELGPGIRIYKEHGVVGLFYQGNYSRGGGGEFNELRAWVIAKMMWNPSRDYAKTVDDFLQGYYGKAAPRLRRYLDLMHAPFREPGVRRVPAPGAEAGSADALDRRKHLHIFDQPNVPYLEPERLERAERLFDAAEEAVRDDADLLARVQHARLSVEYTRLQQARRRWQIVGDRYVSGQGPEVAHLSEIVAAKIRKAGITNVHEWNPVQEFLDGLQQPPKSYAAITLENAALRVGVVPELGGRIVEIAPRRTGRNLLTETGRTREAPADGGYEEYSRRAPRSAGWRDPFSAGAAARSAVSLGATLAEDVAVTRTIRLQGDQPVLVVESTYRNNGSQPVSLAPRGHLDLRVAEGSRCGWRDAAGRRAEVALTGRSDRTLAGSDLPDGEWELRSGDRRILRLQFDARAVEQLSLQWDAGAGRASLHLLTPERAVAPGESVTLQWSLAVD